MEGAPSFYKRLAAFALVLLILYYSILSFMQARDNHRLLESQSRALARVTQDLADAKQQQSALIKIVVAQNKEIIKRGGVPIGQGIDSNPLPSPAAAPQPRQSAAVQGPPSTSRSSSPRASAPPSRPMKKPSSRPTSSPTPLVCVTTPLGQVCTPG